MQLSERWLREWVEIDWDGERLCHELTMAGLEVDAYRSLAGGFAGVVIAQVTAVQAHPQADRLRVTEVDIGDGQSRQVVCGASNVRVGLRCPLALPGARVGDRLIQESRLRGVLSQGMLCGEDELGLEVSCDGLMELPPTAPLGGDLQDYLQLDDAILELGITPNRGDCLSVAGLARELAAIAQRPWQAAAIASPAVTSDDQVAVSIQHPACQRYVAQVVRDVDASVATPDWLRRRLERSGVRSVHAVVDITNYVLLELGQPMHAFDRDALHGGITVRAAHPQESLTLLDASTVTLYPDDLVIADAKQAQALAGIMGGQATAVTRQSRHILLEAASFDAVALAGKARRHGLHTDASHRFERGVDPELPVRAMQRAVGLIQAICGGHAGPCQEVSAAEQAARPAIRLRAAQLQRYLGFMPAADTVVASLQSLGMQVDAVAEGWQVQAPSWRFDVHEEVDLIEEVARLYGYDHLPVETPQAALHLGRAPEQELPRERLHAALFDLGYQEAITYSFIAPELQQSFDPQLQPLRLRNPISSELSVMRTRLLPGLVQALQFNQHRQQTQIRLFETGLCFRPTATGLSQELRLAGVLAGTRHAPGWCQSRDALDFYDVKAHVEHLLALAGDFDTVEHEVHADAALHPGQSATVRRAGVDLGVYGRLHPDIEQAMGLNGPVLVFELSLPAILQARKPAARPLSRFPEVRRDIALLIAADIAAARVLETAKKAAGPWLRDLQWFDVYQGQGVPTGQRSLGLSLLWQHDERTLQDDEVQKDVEAVVTALKEAYAAVLRE